MIDKLIDLLLLSVPTFILPRGVLLPVYLPLRKLLLYLRLLLSVIFFKFRLAIWRLFSLYSYFLFRYNILRGVIFSWFFSLFFHLLRIHGYASVIILWHVFCARIKVITQQILVQKELIFELLVLISIIFRRSFWNFLLIFLVFLLM